MEKLNTVQRRLFSFGYPARIVREYKTGTKLFQEEVILNGKDRKREADRYLRSR